MRVNEEYLMKNWYLDLTSTKPGTTKTHGNKISIKIWEKNIKKYKLNRTAYFVHFSVLQFEAAPQNFIRKVPLMSKICYFKAYSHKILWKSAFFTMLWMLPLIYRFKLLYATWDHLHNLKSVQNIYGGVLILVSLQLYEK